MPAPIRFYFDFASPYAYFALRQIEALAEQHARAIEFRPVLLWAVLKAHGVASPLESPVKWAYSLRDMARSAAYHGVPYRQPAQLPFSSHLAARLYHAVVQDRPDAAPALAHRILDALFADGEDISQPEIVHALGVAHGLEPAAVQEAMDGEAGRRCLAETIDLAVADQVCGSPFFILDGEGFFGADRLPQLAWRLAQAEG